MSPLERELDRQRAERNAAEQQRSNEVIRSYVTVQSRLDANLAALTRQIEQADKDGIEVRPGWLFAQARYQQLIQDLMAHTDAFLAKTTMIVTRAQRDTVAIAFTDSRKLATLALGPAPKAAVTALSSPWDRMNTAALDRLIGRASDGTPVGNLLASLTPLAPEKVRDTLAYGVAAGKGPRVIAREVQAAAQITKHRALVIARTETVGAYREASSETWKQTGVVQRWQWQSAKDKRTCVACWAMDGTLHPLDESMGSHPQCRCAKVPVTPSWAELGFTGIQDGRPKLLTGAEVFARLPEADRLAILGRARLDAYNRGEITLQDLVHHTHSPRWGAGIRVKAAA